MCSLAGLSISGRERMSLREDVSSAGDSMALEERGQTPGAAWQTSSDTRPHCRSRTSSLWFGPTACKTVRKLELGCCQKQELPPGDGSRSKTRTNRAPRPHRSEAQEGRNRRRPTTQRHRSVHANLWWPRSCVPRILSSNFQTHNLHL